MLNRSKQIKIAIIHDDRETAAWLVENGGCAVEFEHIGLARRLNRQEILNILLADARPKGLDDSTTNAYHTDQHRLTSALC